MRTSTRVIIGTIGAAVLAIGIGALLLDQGTFDISNAQLEETYRLPQSQFAEVAGARVHYVDEGRGPVIVLIHASYMSLRSWDSIAPALAADHRVIRLDRIGLGLTGRDPLGRYDRDRDFEIIDGLLAKLGVDTFTLVGTSSGGGVAFHYAAAHPDRVTKLVLINSGGLPRTAATDPNRARGTAIGRWIRARYQSKGWWKEQLTAQFATGTPSDELVQQVYDMNRREGQREIARATLGSFKTGDPEPVLGTITAPTLVMWGLKNITLSHLEADVFQYWLVSAPTAKIKIPDAGHYAYLERSDEVARDIVAFVDDQMALRPAAAPCR